MLIISVMFIVRGRFLSITAFVNLWVFAVNSDCFILNVPECVCFVSHKNHTCSLSIIFQTHKKRLNGEITAMLNSVYKLCKMHVQLNTG